MSAADHGSSGGAGDLGEYDRSKIIFCADFQRQMLSAKLHEYYGMDYDIVAEIYNTFTVKNFTDLFINGKVKVMKRDMLILCMG